MALQQPKRCELKHTISTFKGCIQNVRVRNVATGLENFHPWIFQRSRKVLHRATYKIVIDHDLADILLDELIHRMRTNQTRATNHNEFLAFNIHESCS